MIAFGNRAQMTGAEADTWVQLKTKMVVALNALDDPGDPPLIEVPDSKLPDDIGKAN